MLFFGLFLFLVFKTAYPLWNGIPSDLLMQLDPLAAAASMLASRSFIPEMALSLIVVGLTILLGRVFCGWICPMGTTLDLSDRVFFRKRHHREGWRMLSLKYYVLAGLAVTAVFTMQFVYLLDPLSLIHRAVVIGFVAPVQMTVKWFADHLYVWSGSSFGPLASASMWLGDRMAASAFVSSQQTHFRQAFLVLGVFVAIVALNGVSRRFWCRNLCPLGALLGLLSRVPLLKRVVGSGCNDCSRCAHDCKMAAIPENPRLTRLTECIECMDCVEVCPRDAVSFRLRPKPEFHRETSLDLRRRRVLQGMGIGLGLVTVAAVDPGRKTPAVAGSSIKLSSEYLIRPPNSCPESKFVARCTRCGLCMKACPTNGLQPALLDAGIEGIWTPVLVPRIGPCTEQCNACGQVCPTDAIQPFEVEAKKEIFIGTAVILRDQCIAWNAGKQRIVCDEYCSYKAIEWKEEGGARVPTVNEEKCVGCGLCEAACPIQPKAAIRVYSFGDRRGS